MLVDTISKVNNITFNSINLNAYVTSLRGLSETQARVVLSSTSLDKVQKQQILNKLAETDATVSLTSAEATEALTRSLGSKEAANELLVKSGLVTKEQLLAGTTIEVTNAKIAEAVATGMLTKEEGAKILTAFGLASANIGLGTSFKLLAKSILQATVAMVKWLVATPVGVLTLIAGGITVATLAIGKYNEKLEESRQEMIEAGKEASQLTKDLDGLIEQYRKLGEDGKLDNSDREQAYDIQEQINELLGDEVDYINLANGKYEDQLELLKKLQHQKANDKYADFKEAKDSAEESLRSKISNVGVGNNIAKSEMEAIEELSKLPGMDKYLKTYEGDNKGKGKFAMFNVDTSSTEAMVTSYEKMVELRNILSKSYADEIKKGGSLEDFYNNLKEEISELSDAVTKYKEAMSDYNINQAVITFNETEFDVEGLGKIKGAFINSEEAMTGWITSMMNADDVSDGVQAELIALAQTWYPQYIKQINEAVEAEAKKVAQDALADKSLAGNIQGLKNEASALGITEGAMIELVLAEIRFNKNNLNVSQKISALKELAVWAGVAEKKIDSIMSVNRKSSGDEKKVWAERNNFEVIGTDKEGKKWTYNGKEYYSWAYRDKTTGEIYDDIDSANTVLLDKAIQDEIDKFGNVEIDTPYTPTTTDKGSSKDNTPDYEDPTDAIVSRINLRAKELEQQEESIQNAIEIAELENDYKKQISLTNDLIANRKKRVEELSAANAGLHSEAELLRNSNPWDEDSWFDSQGNATEAYYDLYNSSSKTDQEKIKNVFESISKYKKAWVDNDKELVELNKQLLQDAENLNELYASQHEITIRDIEHARDMALEANPFTDTTSYYKQMQDAYHKEAERLRALDPEKYAEDIQALQLAWWDAQNSIADWSYTNSENWIALRNTYNDWDKYGDNEAKAWKRVLDRFKKEFPDELDKIREIEENYYNAIKDEVNEILDLNKSRIESQKTLLQSYYDVSNSVAEAQHEINKEFAASLTMSEYLDERTRDLLFNQKDYNILSDKLVDIQAEADKLQRKYNQDILGATADNLDEITSKYQMQYDIMMKQYEIAKAELEVAKKRQQLDNVLNERNVRMFINGQWQWVANTQDVINAQNEYADAKFEAQQSQVHKEQTESMNELTTASDKFTTIMNEIDSGAIDLRDGVSEITSSLNRVADESVPALENVLDETKTALRNFASGLKSGGSSSGSTYSGSGSSSGGKNYFIASGMFGIEDGSAVTYASGGSGKGDSGSKRHPVAANKSGINISTVYLKQKLAGGTGNTKAGDTLIAEEEPEIYIDNNGHLIPVLQPTIFKDIEAGGKVFNGMQMKNLESLWNLSNVGFNHSLPAMVERNQSVSTTDNSIHIGGITIPEQGNEDWINGLRRYVYTHKGSM